MLIGVTGQIGAGKTTAAKILASFGAAIIDADAIGRQVVDNSRQLRARLAKQFGLQILTTNGAIRRRELARAAFANESTRQQLNELVHPYLLRELRRQMREQTRRYKVVVIDCALLLDWNLDKEMDVVIVIHAGEELRFKRLAGRGIGRQDARARQKAQLPFSEYRKRADRFILNNGTRRQLREKLKRVWAELRLS
ncbi:MAG TPA: dephospho-CoA kinase [Candidatus Deferrimicrobium sp.]|nr:dephospho-CoA kinase [Candidatus Deferrimicrobium sp.]